MLSFTSAQSSCTRQLQPQLSGSQNILSNRNNTIKIYFFVDKKKTKRILKFCCAILNLTREFWVYFIKGARCFVPYNPAFLYLTILDNRVGGCGLSSFGIILKLIATKCLLNIFHLLHVMVFANLAEKSGLNSAPFS